MFSVALLEPEIPGNAGNVARLCAAVGAPLHLIGRLGFSFDHPDARRASVNYWDRVEVHRHVNLDDFLASRAGSTIWMLSTRGDRAHWSAEFASGDTLLFGPESRGLPDSLLDTDPRRVLRIPMRTATRSLNLATAVGVVAYEAVRQLASRGALPEGWAEGSRNPQTHGVDFG